MEMNQFIKCDCMDFMATVPDKFFDLSIVDPPYAHPRFDRPGSRIEKYGNYRKWNKKRPQQDYFDELFRISKNQIIWGGNYFTNCLPIVQGWFVWDKKQHAPSFADGELAWTSFDKPLIIYTLPYRGSVGADEIRIHPTQKPINLYRWLLLNYANQGDKIFDSHVGSASSLIACHIEGFEYIGCEIDPDYYVKSTERLKAYTAQRSLF